MQLEIEQLAQLLAACLHDPGGDAEAQLDTASRQPGFGPGLLTMALTAQASASTNKTQEGIQQLGLVVLKKFCKEHWHESSRRFVPPIPTEEEKAFIRHNILAGLGSPSSKIRLAASMVVAAIAEFDFPQHWPGLLEALVTALKDRERPYQVRGALCCLDMLSHDIEERQLVQVVPVLLPELLDIVSSGAYSVSMQHRALSILRGILGQLGVLTGAYQRQVRDLILPYMTPWIPVISNILNAPLVPVASCWVLKQEALQILVHLINYFSKPMSSQVASLLAPCWGMFVNGVSLYQSVLVDGQEAAEEEELAADDEPLETDEATGLEAMFAQMFELLITIMGNQRLNRAVRPMVGQMAYTCVAYMQMTATQQDSWASDINAYLADEEEDTFTARVSGELLLEELATTVGGPDVIMEVYAAIEQRLSETGAVLYCAPQASQQTEPQQPRNSNSAGIRHAILLREAAMVALGVLSPHLLHLMKPLTKSAKLASKGTTHGEEMRQRLVVVLSSMLALDLQGLSVSPFLGGRALWVASKLSSLLALPQMDVLLNAAAAGIQPNQPLPLRIGACRALATLLPIVSKHTAAAAAQSLRSQSQGGAPSSQAGPADTASAARNSQGCSDVAALAYGGLVSAAKLAPLLPQLYIPLVTLLSHSTNETLHLVLETLAVVLRIDAHGSVVSQSLSQVLGPVINVWYQNVGDPLINEDTLAVLSVLAQYAACLIPLAQQLLPVLKEVVSNPEPHSSILLEGSLELLRVLVVTPRKVSPVTAAALAFTNGQSGQAEGGGGSLQALLSSQGQAAAADVLKQVPQEAINELQQQVQQQQEQLQRDVAQQIHVTVTGPLLNLIASSTDAGNQQSAQQLLCQLIRVGRADLLVWGGTDPNATVHTLMAVARQLLQPGCAEDCGALAGDLVFEMLTHFPQHIMAPFLLELLQLVAVRIANVNMSPLVCGLILVLARLVYIDHNAFIMTLGSSTIPLPGGQTGCALDAVLAVWLDRCVELQGRYRLTIAITALGLLLESRNPRLDQVMVKVQHSDIKKGVQTRAQLQASGGPQITTMPVALKILAVMGDLLADVQESGDCVKLPGNEEEDSEEEDFEEDSEEEEEVTQLEAAGMGGDTQEDLFRSVSETLHEETPDKMMEDEGAADAPAGDPIGRIRLSSWLPELFVKLSLSPQGQQLLQSAGAHTMTPRQAKAAQAAMQASRLSAGA